MGLERNWLGRPLVECRDSEPRPGSPLEPCSQSHHLELCRSQSWSAHLAAGLSRILGWRSHSSSPKLGTARPPPRSGRSRMLGKRALRSRQVWRCRMEEGIAGLAEGIATLGPILKF